MKKPLQGKTTTKVIKTPNGGAIVVTTVYYDDGSDEKIIVNAKRYLNVHDPENEGLSTEQRLDKMYKNFKNNLMNKSEFKEMYLKRMHTYWKENQNIPKDYAILMCDGRHSDFCTAIAADENISIAHKLIQYGRACRDAVLNGGAIEGIKYTEDQILATIFLSEAWFSKSSQTSGTRPSLSSDKETVILFQFIDSIIRETTYYHDVDGELTEFDKDVIYYKNTN